MSTLEQKLHDMQAKATDPVKVATDKLTKVDNPDKLNKLNNPDNLNNLDRVDIINDPDNPRPEVKKPDLAKKGTFYVGIPGVLGFNDRKIPKIGEEFQPVNDEDIALLEYQVNIGAITKVVR